MTELGWLVVVVLLGWASGWVGMWVALSRWERRRTWGHPARVVVEPIVERPEGLHVWPGPTVGRPEPAPEPVKPRGKPTVCRLVTETGEKAGTVTVAVRRPTLRVPGPSGAAVYVASHPDGAEWVYRRVGVERN